MSSNKMKIKISETVADFDEDLEISMALVSLLSSTRKEYQGSHARIIAEANAGKLGEFHKSFADAISRFIDADTFKFDRPIMTLFRQCVDEVVKAADARATRNGDDYSVVSRYSVFDEDDLAQFLQRLQGVEGQSGRSLLETQGVVYAATAAYLYFNETNRSVTAHELGAFDWARLSMAVARIGDVFSKQKQERALIAKANEMIDKAGELKPDIDRLQQLTKEAQEQSDKTREMVQRNVKMQNEFDKRVEKINDDMEAFQQGLDASIEDDRLKIIGELWKKRIMEYKISFWSSSLLIAFSLIGVALAIFYQSDYIIDYINKMQERFISVAAEKESYIAAAFGAAGRTFVIAIPIALFIWFVRILVRFNMRSMLLLDDAEQRNTIIDTYIRLVDRGAANIDDRPIVLEALFRRVPGHGSDTVAPPNLSDMLTAVMKQKQ